MKRQTLLLAALSLVVLFTNCSKKNLETKIPEPEAEAISSIDTCISVLAPNFVVQQYNYNPVTKVSCPNVRQYIFHGNFGLDKTGDYFIEVNCVKNPSNWDFSILIFRQLQYDLSSFLIKIEYPKFIPTTIRPYLTRDDLIFTMRNGPCKEFANFKSTGSSGQGNVLSNFLIHLPDDFWDCYEMGTPFTFDFFVTGTYDFPVDE